MYILGILQQAAWGQTPSLKWRPNGSLGIAGYRVSIRSIHDKKAQVIDVGNRRSITFDSLPPETKHVCTVIAYNTLGLESEPSNEVSFVTPPTDFSVISSEGSETLVITGTPGRKVRVYGSDDMVHWTLLTSVVNHDGTVELAEIENYPSGIPSHYRLESGGESFTAWMEAHKHSDPLADDNHDGINHLEEFIIGADLAASPHEARPSVKLVDDPTGAGAARYACFSYTYREDNGDFAVVAESSADMRTWQEASTHTVVAASTLNGNGTRTVTLRESSPVDSDPGKRRVYRLRYLPLGQTFLDWIEQSRANDLLGDSNGDGLDNFATYASGTDLQPGSVETRTRMGTARFEVGGRTSLYATLSYSLREGAVGVSSVIESSPDLAAWSEAGHEFTEISSELRASGIRVITLRSTAPLLPYQVPRHYFRVRMQSDEPWAITTPYGLQIAP